MQLKGKIALITGGSKGIGFACAKILVGYGCKVVLVARQASELESAKQALDPDKLGNVDYLCCDVSNPKECEDLANRFAKEHERLDILLNCAGINIRKKTDDVSISEYQRILSVNLDGTFYMCKFLHNLLKNSGHGKIINVSSLMAAITRPRVVPYAASKGGVVQLTKALAVEWAGDNICVNAVLPGFTLTEMSAELTGDLKFYQYVLDRTPLKRWASPDDTGELAAFLASDHASFITGAAIPVDGGILASLGWMS